MKKITLLAALFVVAISYGQIKQLKGNGFATSGCGAGGKGDVWYPNGFTGGTANYAGESATANWEIIISPLTTEIWMQCEVIFENNIPASTSMASMISISSVDFNLTAYAHNATGNTLTGCGFSAGQLNKIRFNLEYTGTYVIGTPVTLDITTTDPVSFIANTIAVTVTPDTSASIEDLEKFNFSYGPNPTSDVLRLSSMENISSVKVVNILGQEVLSSQLDVRATTIDISSLNEGVYILKVAIRDEIGTFRIVKE